MTLIMISYRVSLLIEPVTLILCMFYLGSLEIQVVTMTKLSRSKIDEVYVCGFVPGYLLPNRMPRSLDRFLDPFVTELEDIFIDGLLIKIMYTNI